MLTDQIESVKMYGSTIVKKYNWRNSHFAKLQKTTRGGPGGLSPTMPILKLLNFGIKINEIKLKHSRIVA